MKQKLLLVLIFFCFFTANAQWTPLQTGINDNLTGIVFYDENGMVSGEHGLYYTTTGGASPASWTRFEITNDNEAATLYNSTKFNHCIGSPGIIGSSGAVYACGRNMVTGRAVIMWVNLPSMNYFIHEIDLPNSTLYRIASLGDTYATGNNGLLAKIGFSQTIEIIPTGITDDLYAMSGTINDARIGAANKMFKLMSFNGINMAFTAIPTPGITHQDVEFTGSVRASSVGNHYATVENDGNVNVNSNYHYGPLHGNALTVRSGYQFIATDHGIFRTRNPATVLEFQPSGGTSAFTEIWSQHNSAPIYACGGNGIIFKTSNLGGGTQPYAGMTITGGCLNGITNFKSFYPGVAGSAWLLNGVPFGNTANFDHVFTAPGTYEITLTVTNGTDTNTNTQSLTITPYPNVTLPVTVSDAILCKSEPLVIEIGNSEPNVHYVLKKQGDTGARHHGISAAGNGGLLVFTSNELTESGTYYLQAEHVTSHCSLPFPDVFTVQVEQTAAIFHSGRINAEVGESVPFYGHPVEADTFAYGFSNNAVATTPNQVHTEATFATVGPVTSTYTVTSPNGCVDVRSKNLPTIHETPDSDGCFLLRNDSRDPQWPGYYNKDIWQMTPVRGGFLICGTYMDEIFDSRHGQTFGLPGKKGGYLAKYDLNGAIKWIVYTTATPGLLLENDNAFLYTAEDSHGNIYASGMARDNTSVILHDNTGKETPLSGYLNNFLVKLSPEGELIWRMESMSNGFQRLAIDTDDNVIASMIYSGQWQSLYLNGTLSHEENLQQYSYYLNYGITKFSPEGAFIWDKKIFLNAANLREISDMGVDGNNNVYAAMAFDGNARIYGSGVDDFTDIQGIPGQYGAKLGLLKLNTGGNLVWTMRSRTQVEFHDTTFAHRMLVEPDGTLYITGENDCGINYFETPEIHLFENVDGSVTSTTGGPYFVARVSADGICNWVRGSRNNSVGFGHTLLKSGNELYVVGQVSENGGDGTMGSTLDSTDGINATTHISGYAYFIAVYDLDGNVKRIMLNGDGTNEVNFEQFPGFFKADNGQLYLAKNLWAYNGTNHIAEFGMTAPLNGREGVISRFNPDCAIIAYDSQLGMDEANLSEISLAPNPTNGHFAIQLNKTLPSVAIEISDITGKQIFSERYTNVSQINAEVVGQRGIYFVKVVAGEKVKWLKLINN